MVIIVKSLKLAMPAFLVFAAFGFLQSASAAQAAKSKTDAPAAAAKSDDEAIPPVEPDAIFPAVVARVNGKPVLGRDLEVIVRRELARIGSPEWKSLREDYRNQLTLSALASLVNTQLLHQKALAAGTAATDAEVQAELQKIAATYKSDAEMNEALARQMMDRESHRKSLDQQLTISKYVAETINKSITVTPEEIAKFYAEHPKEFAHPDLVRSSHIMILGGETPELDARSKQRAEALLARVKKGEDFAKLAKEHSMADSASTGGDNGFASKQALETEIGEAAFSMAVGEVRLVKNRYGYHVLKVTDKKKEGVAPLEEVRDQLTQYLKSSKAQEALAKLVNQLREQAKIEVLISLGQSPKP